MSAKTRIIDLMKKRAPWKTIISSGGKSSAYDSWASFMPEAEREYTDICNALEIMNKKLKESERKGKQLDTENKRKEKIIKEKETQMVSFEHAINELKEKEEKKVNELKGLTDKFEELTTRGITQKGVSFIAETDVESDQALFDRVKTVTEFKAVQGELKNLRRKLKKIIENIEENRSLLATRLEEVTSVENNIAYLKETHAHLDNALEIVMDALKRYPLNLITGLFKTLRRFEIKNQPTTSIRRLLNKLDSAREDLELERSIANKRLELSVISQELAVTKSTITALKTNALKPIQETQNIAIQAIEHVSNSGVNAVRALQGEVTLILQDTKEAILLAINALHKSGQDKLSTHQEELLRILDFTSLKLQRNLDFYESEIKRWGQQKMEAGRYQPIIQQGTLLFGILQDERAILNLNPKTAAQVAKRLHLYVTAKFPDAKTQAPADVARHEFSISDTWETSLTSVTKWLALALEEVIS